MKQIADMTTAEILAEYNLLTGNSVKRFASRTAAERRLIQARADHEPGPDVRPSDLRASVAEATAAARSAQAEGVAKSWHDPAVRAARAQRNGVEVDGVEYKSTAAAFRALSLPFNKHVAFRGKLKAAGTLEFEDHTFRVLPVHPQQ